MRNNKLFTLIAALALAALMLAACQGSTTTGGADPTDADPTDAEGTTAPDEPEEEAPDTASGDPVDIRWFVGLGTGGDPEQIDAQNAAVEAFNASQDSINLIVEINDNDVAYDNLSTQIAAGNAPDIVGPVGFRGANTYEGRWLDINPLIESAGYDLSRFPEAQVEAWTTDDGLLGIPFGVFPAMIFYNTDLFDEAGLPYPPANFGEDYEGEPWTFDTLADLAQKLTVDENGLDATEDGFDPDSIVQFGYEEQWTDGPNLGSAFGAGSVVDDAGNAQIPDEWRAAFNWFYDMMWERNASPINEFRESDLLAGGNPFDSGNVAMARTHLWYTCCLANVQNWDLAPMPEYNGNVTAPLHADVFLIMDSTEHPEEAFEALTYLVGEGAPGLLNVYGAMPADESMTQPFFDQKAADYPSVTNWHLATESLAYPDIPSHEQGMPNYQRAYERVSAFHNELSTNPSFDVDGGVDALVSDLQEIFDAGE